MRIHCLLFLCLTLITTKSLGNIAELLKGEAANDRLYVGLFSYHTHPESRKTDNAINNQLGLSYKGWFAITFKNSFYNQTYAAGVQRNIYTHKVTNKVDINLGYRAGFIYGYDGRMATLFEKIKVMPGVLPYITLESEKIGVEFQYMITAFTAGFYYTF